MKLSQTTRETAIALRKSGDTYKQISEKLGISLDWCKKNLRVVNSEQKDKFTQLYTKSKTKQAVSRTEVYHLLGIDKQDYTQQTKLLSAAIRRIRANHSDNVVRPDWMLPQAARYCLDTVTQTALDIDDRLNEEAYALRLYLESITPVQEHSTLASTKKIKNAMLSLVLLQNSNKPNSQSKLHAWLESLYNTANALEQRNQTQNN